MLDIKALNIAIDTLGAEKKISRERLIDAVEKSLAAAYQKEFGKRGQYVRCKINMETGEADFEQVKIVVDETTVRMPRDDEDENEVVDITSEENTLPRYNEERHILLNVAQMMKKNVLLGEELVFPLDREENFGRIAAQTAKQVIVQKLREAERESIMGELSDREGEIVSGTVQRIERGFVHVDLGRVNGVMPVEEQIPGERLQPGSRIRAYLYKLEDGERGLSVRLSRTHPRFLIELFKIESQEIADGTVEILNVAREPGQRSKISVRSTDPRIDPVGACVGQRGSRVSAITQELNGEKIDVIVWDEDPKKFITASLSPAKPINVEVNVEEKHAAVTVAQVEQSLAIGRGGQNVRLAAKLTGYRIDISTDGEVIDSEDGDSTLDDQAKEEIVSNEGMSEQNQTEIQENTEN